jgi:hypothetical protein
MVLLLVLDTQELSKTVLTAVEVALLLMVETQQVTPNLVQVALVVTFQHGLVSQQQLRTRVAEAAVRLFGLRTGATHTQAILLAV